MLIFMWAFGGIRPFSARRTRSSANTCAISSRAARSIDMRASWLGRVAPLIGKDGSCPKTSSHVVIPRGPTVSLMPVR